MDIPERKDLQEADFQGADLIEVNLEGANFQGANLKWTYFIGANFKEADLEGANLEGAIFEGANLKGANLIEAHLEGTNLEGAKNLSFNQLSKVKTLYSTILDEELLISLKEKYPTLFEKPDK